MQGASPGNEPMYAVIKSGGKQYRVQSGAQVRVEALPAEVGAAISFDEVLLVGEGDNLNIGMGRDHTLFARIAGQVQYAVKGENSRKTVSIISENSPA